MSWHDAHTADALGAGEPRAVTIGEEMIVLWRGEGGRPIAFADRCAHMALPLSTGLCENGRLRCRYHGLEYDANGAVVGVFGAPIQDARRVKTYPAAERRGRIWVWMGDPQIADEALIPATDSYRS